MNLCVGLSGMSKLTSLKELDLCDAGVELHEDDMRMLEGLQLLEPVLVATMASYNSKRVDTGFPTYRLDFHRHKILWGSKGPVLADMDATGMGGERSIRSSSRLPCWKGFYNWRCGGNLEAHSRTSNRSE